jgi:hypothetical protein
MSGNKERFLLQLQVEIEGEWHTISEMKNSGSQNTGRIRKIADNATVPMRIIEVHGDA